MRSWVRAGMVAMAGVLAAPQAMAETLADAMISAYRNSSLLDQNQAVLRAAIERGISALEKEAPGKTAKRAREQGVVAVEVRG